MSDFSVRARRRINDDYSYSNPSTDLRSSSSVIDFSDHDNKKSLNQPPQTSSAASFYNPLSTVFNASPAQLWSSAQEAFSSIPAPSYYQTPFDSSTTRRSETPEPVFPQLSIFGEVIDQLIFTMPSRDRTSEFRTTAKSYQMKMQPNGHIAPKHEILGDSIQFNQLAKKIGHDLSETCVKMEKLAELAKKKTLFDDRNEIEYLTRVVKEDMTGLNKQIAALQEFSRHRNGGVKNQGAGHSQLVVVGLQSKLANVSKDFQSVLEISTENMKHQKSRREKFSQVDTVHMSLPTSSSSSNVRSRLLLDDEQQGNGSVALDMGAMEQYTSQQMMHVDQSNAYAQARSSTMETIEGSISELGQIFSQLASLVSEQGEMITRIDSNVEETSLNIDQAHSELVKYFHNISKNRWLMIKVFGVLMIFFIVFVLFLT